MDMVLRNAWAFVNKDGQWVIVTSMEPNLSLEEIEKIILDDILRDKFSVDDVTVVRVCSSVGLNLWFEEIFTDKQLETSTTGLDVYGEYDEITGVEFLGKVRTLRIYHTYSYLSRTFINTSLPH